MNIADFMVCVYLYMESFLYIVFYKTLLMLKIFQEFEVVWKR